MRIDLGAHEEPEIGLIALIDCIFFLLMFFMVATSFKLQEAANQEKLQRITLPKADVAFAAADAAPAPFVIGIDAAGRLLQDDQPISLESLREQLHEIARTDRQRLIRIDGDQRTSLQQLVHVLDLCQFEGLTQIAVRTR